MARTYKAMRKRPVPILEDIENSITHIPIVGCMIWTKTLLKSGGYGVIGYEGKHWRAHRLVWTLTNGPIPDGMYVCHRCDTPSCVNPHHMFLGTPRDNTHDMFSKNRNRNPGAKTPLQGSKSRLSKLTEADVLEIRRLASIGVLHRLIADQFGVNRTNIVAITKRKSWRHI